MSEVDIDALLEESLAKDEEIRELRDGLEEVDGVLSRALEAIAIGEQSQAQLGELQAVVGRRDTIIVQLQRDYEQARKEADDWKAKSLAAGGSSEVILERDEWKRKCEEWQGRAEEFSRQHEEALQLMRTELAKCSEHFQQLSVDAQRMQHLEDERHSLDNKVARLEAELLRATAAADTARRSAVEVESLERRLQESAAITQEFDASARALGERLHSSEETIQRLEAVTERLEATVMEQNTMLKGKDEQISLLQKRLQQAEAEHTNYALVHESNDALRKQTSEYEREVLALNAALSSKSEEALIEQSSKNILQQQLQDACQRLGDAELAVAAAQAYTAEVQTAANAWKARCDLLDVACRDTEAQLLEKDSELRIYREKIQELQPNSISTMAKMATSPQKGPPLAPRPKASYVHRRGVTEIQHYNYRDTSSEASTDSPRFGHVTAYQGERDEQYRSPMSEPSSPSGAIAAIKPSSFSSFAPPRSLKKSPIAEVTDDSSLQEIQQLQGEYSSREQRIESSLKRLESLQKGFSSLKSASPRHDGSRQHEDRRTDNDSRASSSSAHVDQILKDLQNMRSRQLPDRVERQERDDAPLPLPLRSASAVESHKSQSIVNLLNASAISTPAPAPSEPQFSSLLRKVSVTPFPSHGQWSGRRESPSAPLVAIVESENSLHRIELDGTLFGEAAAAHAAVAACFADVAMKSKKL